jgi:hypothetical protein
MKPSKTPKFFWVAFCGFILLGMSSLGSAAPSGKITVGMGTDTPTLDPHRHTEKAGTIMHSQIFDCLFSRQADFPRTGSPWAAPELSSGELRTEE